MKNNDYFSFLLIRPDGKETFAFRIRKNIFVIAASSILILILGLVFGAYFYSQSGAQILFYKKLKKQTVEQQENIESLERNINDLKEHVEELVDKESQIKRILGEDRFRRNRRSRAPQAKEIFKTSFAALPTSDSKVTTLTTQISFLKKTMTELDGTISGHLTRTQQLKSRFAFTPSIWPLHGYVKSGFGFRTHPISGKRRFHNGIDIPAWVGAPIKATADGYVEYAGWSGSFGYVIVLNHSYGYRTVYAHTSKLLVEKGDAVKKGQNIAQVGTTGISTGPHLHYEVRRWRKAVSPRDYLDLDMFTASTKLW